MKANRMQKPTPKAARSRGLRRCSIQAANGELRYVPVCIIGVVCATV